MSSALERLKELTSKISSYELTRKENYKKMRSLFTQLGLEKKCNNFEQLFTYKAVNLSGVSLQKESFGKIYEGKYLQLLAIANIDGKSKNISLAYFGRVEKVEEATRKRVMEFVIRYRFEKTFRTLEHYHELIEMFESDV